MSRYGQNSVLHQPCIRNDNSVSSNTCSAGEQSPLNSRGSFPNKNNTNQKNEYRIYQNYDYDPPLNNSIIGDEQIPLQRPRPPENPRIGHDPHDYDEVTPSPELPRRTLSFSNRNQCSANEQNGFHDIASISATPTPSVPRRIKRDNGGNTPQPRWSSRISERLSSVIINPFMYVNQNSSNNSDRTRNNGYKYESCAITSDDTNMNKVHTTLPKKELPKDPKKKYSCRQMFCVVIIPAIILSLIVISLCSLTIYFYMIQVR